MSTYPSSAATTQHAIRQLKLVVPGGAITYYLGTFQEFWWIVQGAGGSWGRLVNFRISSWYCMLNVERFLVHLHRDRNGRTAALAALGHGFTTVVLFVYLLMSPWITGVEPNVRHTTHCFRYNAMMVWIVSFMEAVRDIVICHSCEFYMPIRRRSTR